MKSLSTIRWIAIALIPSLGFAQDYEIPRTEWGLPDLQGVWNFSSSTPMMRPAQYGNRQYLTDEEVAEIQARSSASDAASDAAIPGTGVDEAYNDFWIESAGLGRAQLTSHIIYPENGRLPSRQENAFVNSMAEAPDRPVRSALGVVFNTDGPEDRPLSDRCIIGFNAGPPVTPSFYNNNLQIVQNKDHVVIITEMVHDARVVPLGEKPHAPDEIGLWTGDSRGYWDGDSLVVETKNFNGLTNTFSLFGSSENKHLTEKFTRVAHDQINYEFTIDDPETFTDKIVGLIPIYKVAGQIYEYACHEGNYGMVNILRGARVQEQLEESD
ncbi:MAG: hypothetical protein GKR91_12500 [Pseudomonadales bacterium]|nr:hypothetical protein [Pseudomonadales bacterium]